MIPDGNIWHIYPTNDLQGHVVITTQGSFGLHCSCQCQPEIEEVDGKHFVVHNSFDGREGVEWANEILKDQDELQDTSDEA